MSEPCGHWILPTQMVLRNLSDVIFFVSRRYRLLRSQEWDMNSLGVSGVVSLIIHVDACNVWSRRLRCHLVVLSMSPQCVLSDVRSYANMDCQSFLRTQHIIMHSTFSCIPASCSVYYAGCVSCVRKCIAMCCSILQCWLILGFAARQAFQTANTSFCFLNQQTTIPLWGGFLTCRLD